MSAHICTNKTREAIKTSAAKILLVDNSIVLSVPFMDQKEFARLVGVTYRVVTNWVTRGYIPVVEIGHRVLINLALMAKQLIDGADFISVH